MPLAVEHVSPALGYRTAAAVLMLAAFSTCIGQPNRTALYAATTAHPHHRQFAATGPVTELRHPGDGVHVVRQLDRPAAGAVLVATRQLIDPNFGESVVLLMDVSAGGAIGVVINRPSHVSVATALPQVDELRNRTELIYLGGPVQTGTLRILAAIDEELDDAIKIAEGLYYLDGLQVLRQLLASTPQPPRMRFYAGYSGWSPGQLEHEVKRGDWLVGELDLKAVFSDDPERVWSDLINALSGIWVRQGLTPPGGGAVKLLTRKRDCRPNVNQFTFFPFLAVDRYTISYTELQQCDRIRTLMFDTSSPVRVIDGRQ